LLGGGGGCLGDEPQLGQTHQAVTQVEISHITFGTIGLDSNDVNAGPNVFPVGVRITNTGGETATDLTATFAFTTTNANINLDAPPTVNIASLAPGAHTDAYFNVNITRIGAAYNASRQFQVTVSGTGFSTVTSPAPRELYVEKLVSQNRNSITGVTGPTAVNIGEIQSYDLDVETAPGGYEQVEAFLTFPTRMFQVLSTATTYTAPAGATSDKIYADACGWNPVPGSLMYRKCIGPENFPGGKAGGTIHTTYTVKVIGSGTANVTAAIYDFSGSSYHYNSDFGTMLRSQTTSLTWQRPKIPAASRSQPRTVATGTAGLPESSAMTLTQTPRNRSGSIPSQQRMSAGSRITQSMTQQTHLRT
jgi:hypothetical protein